MNLYLPAHELLLAGIKARVAELPSLEREADVSSDLTGNQIKGVHPRAVLCVTCALITVLQKMHMEPAVVKAVLKELPGMLAEAKQSKGSMISVVADGLAATIQDIKSRVL